jgi:hypothetical protein
MRNLAARVNPGGVVILFVVCWIGLGFVTRFVSGSVTVSIRNLTPLVQNIRIVDGTSGRTVGTLSIAGDSTVRLADQRVDVWYRDLSIQELADGRTTGMIAQLLSPDCALLAEQFLDSSDARIDIEAGELVLSDASDPPGRPAVKVTDPCAGQPARPPQARGFIANLTKDAIVVGPRWLVEPCSTRSVVADELAGVPDANVPRDAVRVRVPSIDAQDDRWPLEPRSVVVSADDLFDGTYNAFGPGELATCAGHVPQKFVIPG